MAEFIQDVMQYEFLQSALITSVVIGLVAGLIGCFIVLRGLSLMGDAISHAILPGVALSYMSGSSFFIGALGAGVLTSLIISFVQDKSRTKSDSAVGIVFSAFFALGVIMISKIQTATDLSAILFGNILTVQPADRTITLIVAAIVLIALRVFYKELVLTTFDPVMAKAWGYPTTLIHYGLMLLLTLVTVASVQTVGVILVVSLLITPASTAYLLTDRLPVMLVLSALFGVVSAIIGLYFSFVYNISSGPAIVLCATLFFFLAFLFSPKKGLVFR